MPEARPALARLRPLASAARAAARSFLRRAGRLAAALARTLWRWSLTEMSVPRGVAAGTLLMSGLLALTVLSLAGALLRPVSPDHPAVLDAAMRQVRLTLGGAGLFSPGEPAEASAPEGGTPPGACAELAPRLAAPVAALCGQIDEAAVSQGLDPRVLAVLVNVECPFAADARCVSHVGAFGRAQLMPETARYLAGVTGLPCEGSHYDHPTNLACGARYYVEGLIEAAAYWRDGRELTSLLLAAVGYNAGHGEIPDGVACVEAGTPLERCWEIPAETRAYVARWRPLLLAAGYEDAATVSER